MDKIRELNVTVSGASRWPDGERKDDKFYFELRDEEECGYSICKHVLVNNIGSIEADRDILVDTAAFGLCSSDYPICFDTDLFEIYETVNWH